MQKKEFWLILGVGALVGGIAAILYAPQSGASTRKKLKRGLEDLSDNLEEAAEYLKEQAERISEEAQRLIDSNKGQFNDAIDAASGYVQTATKATKAVSKLI